jgi:hypothetical protein
MRSLECDCVKSLISSMAQWVSHVLRFVMCWLQTRRISLKLAQPWQRMTQRMTTGPIEIVV